MFSSRSHVHSPGAQTKSQAAAPRAQTTPNPTHLRHRAAALPRAHQSSPQQFHGGAGMRAAALPQLVLGAHHRSGVGRAQICVVSWPAGAGCSPSSWWRTSLMLGRSWGFSVIMEESRRCKAAEYLEERQRWEGWVCMVHKVQRAAWEQSHPPQHLTWSWGAQRWGSALPEPRCRPSGRWRRRGPPQTSCSRARSLGTGVVGGSGQACGGGTGAEGTEPYPDICALIYDTLAGHREELRGTVGDGAALGSPVLQRGG